MTEGWTFDSVPDSEVLKFHDEPASQVIAVIPADAPYTLMIMKDGEKIGQISFEDKVLRFEGNMDESAAHLMLILKRLADQYIAEKLCSKDTPSF